MNYKKHGSGPKKHAFKYHDDEILMLMMVMITKVVIIMKSRLFFILLLKLTAEHISVRIKRNHLNRSPNTSWFYRT